MSKGRSKRLPVEILTETEVRDLMRACSRRAPTGIRNRALIALLWRTGLRVSEALALYPKDLDLEAGTCRVLHGKNDRTRTVGIDPEACAHVARWLDRRAAIGFNGRAPIFCTLAGGPMSTDYVRALMPRLARRAGIEKRVHAHGLRHTHAAELMREGFTVGIIQRQLGHASLATTARYLDHISPVEVVDAIRSRTWSTPEGNGDAGDARKREPLVRVTGKIGDPDSERVEIVESDE